jgi:hypothetical protein
VKKLIYFLAFFICLANINVSAELTKDGAIALGVVGGAVVLGLGSLAIYLGLTNPTQPPPEVRSEDDLLLTEMQKSTSYDSYMNATNAEQLGKAIKNMADELKIEPSKLIEVVGPRGSLYIPRSYLNNDLSSKDWGRPSANWQEDLSNIQLDLFFKAKAPKSYQNYLDATNAEQLENAIQNMAKELDKKPLDLLNELKSDPQFMKFNSLNKNLSSEDWEDAKLMTRMKNSSTLYDRYMDATNPEELETAVRNMANNLNEAPTRVLEALESFPESMPYNYKIPADSSWENELHNTISEISRKTDQPIDEDEGTVTLSVRGTSDSPTSTEDDEDLDPEEAWEEPVGISTATPIPDAADTQVIPDADPQPLDPQQTFGEL